MKAYVEIILHPNAEIPLFFLWEKVFTQIHIAFVSRIHTTNKMSYAVSFPDYDVKNHRLGDRLRIFAEDRETLDELDLDSILIRLREYIHVTKIRLIPSRKVNGYAVYSRYQPDTTAEQKRHEGVTYDQALGFMKQRKEKYDLPYIPLKSVSNKHSFNLFIAKKFSDREVEGEFGSYGLSSVATVPEF